MLWGACPTENSISKAQVASDLIVIYIVVWLKTVKLRDLKGQNLCIFVYLYIYIYTCRILGREYPIYEQVLQTFPTVSYSWRFVLRLTF